MFVPQQREGQHNDNITSNIWLFQYHKYPLPARCVSLIFAKRKSYISFPSWKVYVCCLHFQIGRLPSSIMQIIITLNLIAVCGFFCMFPRSHRIRAHFFLSRFGDKRTGKKPHVLAINSRPIKYEIYDNHVLMDELIRAVTSSPTTPLHLLSTAATSPSAAIIIATLATKPENNIIWNINIGCLESGIEVVLRRCYLSVLTPRAWNETRCYPQIKCVCNIDDRSHINPVLDQERLFIYT